MIKSILKKTIIAFGANPQYIKERISKWSIRLALAQDGSNKLVKKLREMVPDISNQESSEKDTFNDYYEFKRRSLQAFQCSLMIKALNHLPPGRLTVIDIGDSTDTHMLYLKELTKTRFDIETISVNLDP